MTSSGKVGVSVLIVALAVAIMGSWALSMDVDQVEVTKYDPLADITGLFESTNVPEYIEYSPSTNYTGYYTDASVFGGTKYFDGVDFTESDRANQYRVTPAPYNESTDDYTLASSYTVDGTSYAAIDARWTTSGYYPYCYAYRLSDLITYLGYSSSETYYFEFTSTNTPSDYTDDEDYFVTFVSTNDIHENAAGTDTIALNLPDGPQSSYTWAVEPMLGCTYDQNTGLATLYYDADLTDAAVSGLSAAEIYVWWDSPDSTYLGNELTVYSIVIPASEYMDPSKGVSLS